MKKKPWINPVKRPPKESTMNTEGDFGQFAEFMRGLMKAKPEREKAKPASPGPAVS